MEREDDQVAAAVNHLASISKIDRQFVPALNDTTFYTETAQPELRMVLFYLKCK